ncbi:MAG: response regulator [Armatimonadetes bacterium]|nr:response regulator [Armatimonadota bacterium]
MVHSFLSGLRTRLTILVLLAILPVTGLTVFGIIQQHRRAARDASSKALRLVQVLASEQERLAEGARQLLETLAQLPAVREGDRTVCSTLFATLLKGSPLYTNIGAIGRDGGLFCSARPVDGFRDVTHYTVQRALQTRQFAAGADQHGRVTAKPAVIFAYPVLTETGQVRVLVFAGLHLARLTQLVGRTQRRDGSVITVLDGRGTILARHPDGEQWVGKTVPDAPIVKAILTRRISGTVEAVGLDGVARLYAFAAVRGTPQDGDLYVSVGIPRAAAYAEVIHLRQGALAGLLIVGLLALMAARAGSTMLVLAPVRSLMKTAGRLSAGDFSARTGLPYGSGELGQLARALDNMAESLELREAQLRDANASVRINEERFRRLAENAQDLIYRYRLSPARWFEYVSPAATAMTGYTPQEYYADPELILKMVHPEDRGAWQRQIHGGAAQAEPVVARWIRKDRTLVWTEQRSVVISDRDGHPVAIESIVRDITERKRAEEDRLAMEAAERANRAKSEFLSRTSHELRTPLNAILGFSQLLEMDQLTADQRQAAEQITRAGQHLLSLIDEMLDMARIEAGHIRLSLEPVPLRQILAEACDLMRPMAVHRNVRLQAIVPDHEVWFVLADPQRLNQVILNLLSNAIKYNRDPGTATLSCRETPTGRLRITVRDEGPGISQEQVNRLFSPFERLDADQTPVEGTGLGLALSKQLVEIMGGTMGVESRVGQGSTFWVDLPLIEGPEKRPPLTADGPSEPALTAAPENSGMVLSIEDSLSNLTLIERALVHRPQLAFLAAVCGRTGLDLAREHGPRLILVDLDLPDIPGTEVVRRLREDPETRQIPVAVISADTDPRQIHRLLAAGAQAYLTKPLDVSKFLDLIDVILQDRADSDDGSSR